MVCEARTQAMAWMEMDYSKHTHFRCKIKWRLEHLGALGIMGGTAILTRSLGPRQTTQWHKSKSTSNLGRKRVSHSVESWTGRSGGMWYNSPEHHNPTITRPDRRNPLVPLSCGHLQEDSLAIVVYFPVWRKIHEERVFVLLRQTQFLGQGQKSPAVLSHGIKGSWPGQDVTHLSINSERDKSS